MRGIVLLCVLVLICASAEELVIGKGHGQGGKPKLIEKVFKNGVPSHLPLNKINEALGRGTQHILGGARRSSRRAALSEQRSYADFTSESCGKADLAFGTAITVCENEQKSDPEFLEIFQKLNDLEGAMGDLASEGDQAVMMLKLCTSSCVKAVVLSATNPEYSQCGYDEFTEFGLLLKALCSENSGTYCGFELYETMEEINCEQLDNVTSCLDNEFCQYVNDTDNANEYCTYRLYDPTLEKFCTPCMRELLFLQTDIDPDIFCSKVDKKFCTPLIYPIVSSPPPPNSLLPLDLSMLNAICDSKTIQACLRIFGTAEFSTQMEDAFDEYASCAQRDPNPSSCYFDYYANYSEIYRVVQLAEALCFKNADERICTSVAAGGSADPTEAAAMICVTTVMDSGSCFGCEYVVNQVIQTLGCCVNELEALAFGMPPFPRAAHLPGDYVTQEEIDAFTYPAGNSFYQLSACTGVNGLEEALATPCEGHSPMGSATKTMLLNIPFNHITSAARTAILEALRVDIGLLASILPTGVIIGSLAGDSSFAVDGMVGTKYTFTLRGKDWLVALASSSFDSKAKYGKLVAPFSEFVANQYGLTSKFLPFVRQTGSVRVGLLGNEIDICYSVDFFDAMEKIYLACSDEAMEPVLAFFGKGTDPTKFSKTSIAQSAFNDFCGGSCFSLTRELVNGRYRPCLSDKTLDAGARLFAIMCEPDTDGNFCGATLAQFSQIHSCKKIYNEENCTGLCKWFQHNFGGTCEPNPTSSFLSGICNDCVSKLTAVLPVSEMAESIIFAEKAICAQTADGEFCYPDFPNNALLERAVASATVTDVCSSWQKQQCMNKIYGTISALSILRAKESYSSCVQTYQVSNTTIAEKLVQKHCLPNYEKWIMEDAVAEEKLATLCRKNADGKYCWGLLNATTDLEGGCFNDALEDGSCTAACDATISGLMTTLGCCAGTVQQVYTSPEHLLPEEIPRVWGEEYYLPRTATSAPASLTAGTGEEIVDDIGRGMLIYLGNCSSQSNINTTLRRVCAKTRATTTVKKTLTLKIAYSALENDPKLKEKILGALITDLAANLGVPKEDIVSATLVKEPSVVVAPGTAGTKLEFTVQTQDATWTTGAGAQFDKMVQKRVMTLPYTVAVVDTECTSACTGGDDAVSIQTAASQPTLETPPPLGAAPFHSSSIALLIALLALMIVG